MLFSHSKSTTNHPNVIVEIKPMNKVTSTKFLGIEIDSKLTWKNHVTHIEKKISSSLFMIRKIRNTINEKTAFLLYDSIVLSHLSYCCIIWENTYKTSLRHLNSLQKQCIKICFYPKQISSSSMLFSLSNKLRIEDISKMQTAVLVFKFFNTPKTIPSQIFQLIKKSNDIHQHSTRFTSQFNLYQHSCNTNIRQTTFKIFGPNLWNSLSINIRVEKSISSFKNNYKKYLQIISKCLIKLSLRSSTKFNLI